MSKLPVNPFALGAAFVERAVELGWVEIETDGRRSSYFLTDSGNEGLAEFGVKLEKAMQFAVLPERDNSVPRKKPFPGPLHMHKGNRERPHRGQVPRPGDRHARRHGGERRGERTHVRGR